MKLASPHFDISLLGNTVEITRKQTSETLQLQWPAVRVCLQGRLITPSRPIAGPLLTKRSMTQTFEENALRFEVSIALTEGPWLKKRVRIFASETLPTPEYVDMDFQRLPDCDLRLCGYRAHDSLEAENGEEEGSGGMPGCGYPLIGRRFFVGLEHPAGFNLLENGPAYRLRHYPIWQGTELESVDAVLGWADDPREAFADYLDSIRLPALDKPLVSFCTFWSDPYIGNNEYDVRLEAYEAFFKAFAKLGLRPDVFTLDAGWNERQSVFQSKKDVNGDAGLLQLRDLARELGSELSLWLSHNGHMGIAPEHMSTQGLHVGAGTSAAYCGEGFGVMMDRPFVETLKARFGDLVSKIGAVHFKIDWDNECASNDAFHERYPTPHHVRQASLNAYFEIARHLRALDPQVITRNGWWPSPWWLSEANHFWLPQSGDCEYAALPSKTQRDAASTHRDLMYYNVLQRDQTPVPLDCFDNHEFPDAPRNPFGNEPASWCNAVWLSFLRGSTYLAYTLLPESLEDWQVESLKSIMAFCRRHSKRIFVKRGRMILGHPGRGEVYGFLQPGPTESWCVLRNPRPLPQTLSFDAAELCFHPVAQTRQFYPHHQELNPSGGLTLLPHEVKILIFDSVASPLAYEHPFQIETKGSEISCRFPASLTISDTIHPLVHPVQQSAPLGCDAFASENDGAKSIFYWTLTSPSRTRNLEVQGLFKGPATGRVNLAAYASRYPGNHHSQCALPVTWLTPGRPGYGEQRNLKDTCADDERYFSIPVPDGGRFYLTLEVEGLDAQTTLAEAWLTGYEAPSREGIVNPEAAGRFQDCLPYQHPLGFGQTHPLPLGNQEVENV
jgi:hypothetical protein